MGGLVHGVVELPAVLVDDLSPDSAPAHIRGLLKGTKRRIGVVVLVFWSVMVLSPLVLAEAFYWLGGSVFTRLPSEHRLVMPVALTLMGGYLTASFFGGFVTVAFNSVMVTHVYDDLRVVCGSGTVKVPICWREMAGCPFVMLASGVGACRGLLEAYNEVS